MRLVGAHLLLNGWLTEVESEELKKTRKGGIKFCDKKTYWLEGDLPQLWYTSLVRGYKR